MNKYLFLLGVLFLVVPLGLKMWEGKAQVNIVETYQQDLKETSRKKKDIVYQSAKEYNRRLYESGKIDRARYLEELNVCQDGMMGSLEIPKISLKLPVYHGVEESVLASGIGHLPESSLPTGGENTHCVLTGHRGLPEAQLFTRLDELSKGDIFKVNINGHKLWYRVCEIQVVKPEEIEVLRIQKGKDLISLVTCTPYGINTHRLVVTGERIDKSKVTSDGLEKSLISKRDVIVLFLPAICLMPSVLQKWKQKMMKSRRCKMMKMERTQQKLQRERKRTQQKLQRKLQRKIRWKLKRKVKMSVAIFVGILFLFCFYTEITNASSGNITVKLSEGVDSKILYLKVATMFHGEWRLEEEFENCQVDLNKIGNAKQLTEAAEKLELYIHENQIQMRESGNKEIDNGICLTQMEEGLYLVTMEENDNVAMSSTLVSLPGWTGKEMSYDVIVIPKITEKNIAPKTGWNSGEGLYVLSMGISILTLVCIQNGRKPHNRAL